MTLVLEERSLWIVMEHPDRWEGPYCVDVL